MILGPTDVRAFSFSKQILIFISLCCGTKSSPDLKELTVYRKDSAMWCLRC